ncbi:MAG: DUF1805 domain-containing protein [Candidatus Bathyarchaeia archaeon]
MLSKVVQTRVGDATALGIRWQGGQCIIIAANKGLVACGILDMKIAEQWGFAVAIARGTTEKPLVTDEDLLKAPIVEATEKARQLGVRIGMRGHEALEKLT